MDEYQTLQVVAEVSVAFAGFTGLIVALRRRGGPLSAIERYRVKILLFLAFGALFLALLPGLVTAFGVSTPAGRAASVIAAMLFIAAFLGWLQRTTGPIARSAPELFRWAVFNSLVAGHVLAFLLLASSLVFSRHVAPEGAFAAALCWFLLHAALQFVRMLFIRPADDQG